MSITLTPQQLQDLDSEAGGIPRAVDPRSNTAYVLVRETDYESVREVLDDERLQQAIRAVGLRNAAGRTQESP